MGGGSLLTLESLLAQNSYVATDGDNFVGCVSRARTNHPKMKREDVLLCNLCVANNYKGRGIGRQLMRAACDTKDPKDIYLQVARAGLDSVDPDVKQVFEDRVQRLRTTYDRMGFVPVCEDSMCILMRCDDRGKLFLPG